MNSDTSNDKNSDKPGSEKKFVQISPDSIQLIAESAGYSNISSISKSLAEDTSYRLRELIQSCSQILRHSKRTKLTKDDVNLALRWSDVPQIHGPNSTSEDFLYLSDLDIYSSLDRVVELTQEYPIDTDVEVYSPVKLSIQYLAFDIEEKLPSEIYFQYFEKISQSLLSTSECVVKVALANLLENPKLQPLLPALSGFLRNLIGFTDENSHVVSRIPRIFNAIMNNPYLHIGSEHECFLQLIQGLILNHGGEKLDEDIFQVISSILHILAKLTVDSSVPDVVNNLTLVISDVDRHITVQCRALIALRCLSSKYLDIATADHWNVLLKKFYEMAESGKNVLYLEDALIGAIVEVLRYKMRRLDELVDDSNLVSERLWTTGSEMYQLTSELMGSSVLRIGHFSSSLCQQFQRDRAQKAGDSCNEFYWTLKRRHKPLPKSKWRYNLNGIIPHEPSVPIHPFDVFDYSDRKPLRMANIHIRVRNWKQKSMQSLKRKVLPCVKKTPSIFATLSNSNFKIVSKRFIANSILCFYNPVDLIL